LYYKFKYWSIHFSIILPKIICFCYSYRKRSLEHLINLTDYFTLEELLTTDPETGYITKAGYIRIIWSLTIFALFLLGFQVTEGTIRMVVRHDMLITTWFPFEATESPVYEISNLIQVIFQYCLNIYSKLRRNINFAVTSNSAVCDRNPQSVKATCCTIWILIIGWNKIFFSLQYDRTGPEFYSASLWNWNPGG
jgi:hypothetical protein